MRKNKLLYIITLLSITLTGCFGGGPLYSDLNPIQDSLGYEKLLGTYVFKPDTFQAKRLGINPNEMVTLRITRDSLISFNSGSYRGKYYIDKMVMILDPYPKETNYSFTWSYSYFNQGGTNSFELMQHKKTYNSLSYQIEKADDNDTLHITGYGHDPKFEVVRLVDFKKIK